MTDLLQRRTLIAELSAELVGTFILILLGVGVVAQVVAGMHTGGALRDQIIGTAILILLILAITDVRNTSPGMNLGPLLNDVKGT